MWAAFELERIGGAPEILLEQLMLEGSGLLDR